MKLLRAILVIGLFSTATFAADDEITKTEAAFAYAGSASLIYSGYKGHQVFTLTHDILDTVNKNKPQTRAKLGMRATKVFRAGSFLMIAAGVGLGAITTDRLLDDTNQINPAIEWIHPGQANQ
jgi:hypothetical protein